MEAAWPHVILTPSAHDSTVVEKSFSASIGGLRPGGIGKIPTAAHEKTRECWIDDEGEQLDYLIKADNLTSEQVVELSIEIEEKLNFSFPVNVTVRFSSHD